jgi:hypothetical protein
MVIAILIVILIAIAMAMASSERFSRPFGWLFEHLHDYRGHGENRNFNDWFRVDQTLNELWSRSSCDGRSLPPIDV